MSDLHVDYPGSSGLPPLATGVDVVVVAGDTCQGLVPAIETLRRAYPSPTESGAFKPNLVVEFPDV
jgi:hypothetical protein